MKKPTTRGLLTRPEREERAKKTRIAIITASVALGLVGIITCGYGHAAIYSDLGISGEAIITKTGGGFSSKYMQDLTAEECSSVESGETSRMIDKRDGKEYWVAKIGSRCMMTQDLRLDITTDGLTSELTDINSGRGGYQETTNDEGEIILSWNAASTYPPKDTFTAMKSVGTSYTTTYSMNFGDYVLRRPNVNSVCKTNTKGMSACSTQTKDINTIWETDPETGETTIVKEYQPTLSYMESGVTFDDDTLEYDAHYLIGYYYQYLTATAGSSVRTKSSVAPSSICPRGWKLPTAGGQLDQNNDFAHMLGEYADEATASMLNSHPFYISGSGYIQKANLYVVGSQGYYWTDGVSTSSANNVIQLGSSNMATAKNFVSGGDLAYTLKPVRCILRLEE